jgi:DNA mismatch repair protein MSH6
VPKSSPVKSKPIEVQKPLAKLPVLSFKESQKEVKPPNVLEFETNRPEDCLPVFLLPRNILDSKKRKPSDPDYDPTTVFIPTYDYQKLTATMRQYWDIKS